MHGDHGPRLGFDALNPKAGSGQGALSILLAIRWPDGHGPAADPESLVNVYRVLLGHVFHVDVPLLPNRSYISAFDRPYMHDPCAGIERDYSVRRWTMRKRRTPAAHITRDRAA